MTQDLFNRPELPLSQRISFKTSVLTAHDGSETRHALLPRPRQTYQMQYVLEVLEIPVLREKLFNHLNESWRVPVWWDGVSLTATVLGGQAIVQGDFTDSDIAATDVVVLIDEDDTTTEVATVQSVTSSQITLTSNLTNSFFGEISSVYPLVNVRFNRVPRLVRRGFGINVLVADMDLETPTQLTGTPATIATLGGVNILDRRPLADSPYSEEFNWAIQRLDAGRLFEEFTGRTRAQVVRRHTFFAYDDAELQFYRKFLDEAVGRRESFYMSTWQPDLFASSPTFLSGATELRILSAYSFIEWFNASTGMRQIHIQYSDNTETYHRVSNATPDGFDEVLTLTDAMPTSTGQTIASISILERVRLGSDQIQLRHTSMTQAKLSVSVATIQE